MNGTLKQMSGVGRRMAVSLLVLIGATVFANQASAAPIFWRQKTHKVVVVERKLVDLLKELFEESLLSSSIDPSVDATVRNVRFNLRPQELLDLLATRYGFSVYFDGQVVYVTPSSQNVTRIYKLDRSAHEQAKRVIASLRLNDAKFPIRFDEESKLVIASGPPRMIQSLDAALMVLEDSSSAMLRSEAKVIMLKHGVAQDRVMSIGGKDVVIAGVASILRRVFAVGGGKDGHSAAQMATGKSNVSEPSARDRSLAGLGMVSGMPKMGSGPETDAIILKNIQSSGAPEGPTIEALPTLNAIAIRDVAERVKQYEALIEKLDIKAQPVLLEVQIVDIETSALDEIGFDWKVGNGNGGITLGGSGKPPGQIPISGINAPVENGLQAFVSAVRPRSLVQLQLKAMFEKGSAKVISTPKIVTLLTEEGVFSNTSTFYVKVAGNLEANLFAVEAGTSMRLTPLNLTEDNGRKQIRLGIKIEDGTVTQAAVEALPVVQRSSIVTNAVVVLGESLLLAGLSKETSELRDRGVPGLGEVPGLGWLFRSSKKDNSTSQRLFMITPRLIE
jgi:type III secretion protein C